MFSREDTTPDGDRIFQVGGKGREHEEWTLQAEPDAAKAGLWRREGLLSHVRRPP